MLISGGELLYATFCSQNQKSCNKNKLFQFHDGGIFLTIQKNQQMKKTTLKVSVFAAMALSLIACEEDTVTTEIEALSKKVETIYTGEGLKIENGLQGAKVEGALFLENIEQLQLQAQEEFNALAMNMNNLKAATTIPHWVGVLPTASNCPTGVYQFSYYEDLEDKKNKTKWERTKNCFIPGGLYAKKNLTYTVCIVDANSYNFDNINKAYAIFDLSHLQWLNGADEVKIHIDDEDKKNSNKYTTPYYGFNKDNSGDFLPNQKNKSANTNFWLYHFKKATTARRLPNLGFEYAVFSRFDCCDYNQMNKLHLDTEDKSPSNSMTIFPYQGNSFGKSGLLDNTYKIIDVGRNVNLYVQKASAYSY